MTYKEVQINVKKWCFDFINYFFINIVKLKKIIFVWCIYLCFMVYEILYIG